MEAPGIAVAEQLLAIAHRGDAQLRLEGIDGVDVVVGHLADDGDVIDQEVWIAGVDRRQQCLADIGAGEHRAEHAGNFRLHLGVDALVVVEFAADVEWPQRGRETGPVQLDLAEVLDVVGDRHVLVDDLGGDRRAGDRVFAKRRETGIQLHGRVGIDIAQEERAQRGGRCRRELQAGTPLSPVCLLYTSPSPRD